MIVYQYSCAVHGIFAACPVRRRAPAPARRCPVCGVQGETWIGPRVGPREPRELSLRDVSAYWEGEGWVSDLLTEDRWHGQFHDAVDPLHRLYHATLDALVYVQ